MWILGRRFRALEKRIAGLELCIQNQQEEINRLNCQKAHHSKPLNRAVQNVLKDSGNLTFRANLNRKTLFEEIVEQKQ